MPDTTDYTQSGLTITQMVYNRLPMLANTTNNTNQINQFIWENMNELERCFQVGKDDPTKIGKGDSYSVDMQVILADLTAVYMLLLISAQNSQGTSTSASQVKFLKKAKAGSAEAEWGEIDIKKSGVITLGAGLIAKYEASAARRARNLGCVIDICTDCVSMAGGFQTLTPLPFITITDCGCGCN